MLKRIFVFICMVFGFRQEEAIQTEEREQQETVQEECSYYSIVVTPPVEEAPRPKAPVPKMTWEELKANNARVNAYLSRAA